MFRGLDRLGRVLWLAELEGETAMRRRLNRVVMSVIKESCNTIHDDNQSSSLGALSPYFQTAKPFLGAWSTMEHFSKSEEYLIS